MFNDRELAILFWVGVFAAWALTYREVRSSLMEALRQLREPKILGPLWLMAGWVALEVWIGSRAEIWTDSLLTDTAIWFVVSGLVLFVNFSDAWKEPSFFRRKALAAFLPVALLTSLLDLFVLPLVGEIILQPILAVLLLLAAVAKTDERYKSVENLANGLLTLIGLLLIARAAFTLITQWGDLDKTGLLLQAILPVWLTVGLLPFIYAVALYAAYELAFLRVGWKSSANRLGRFRAQLALLTCLHVNAHDVAAFAGSWPHRLATTTTFDQARHVVEDFRRARQDAARAEADSRERLIR